MQRSGKRNQDEIQIERLVSAIISGADRLYDLGHRSFLFISSPAIDIMPQTTLPHEGGYEDRFITKALNAHYVKFLRTQVSDFETRHNDINAMFFDLDAFERVLIAYPEAFGLIELKRYEMRIDNLLVDSGKMGFM